MGFLDAVKEVLTDKRLSNKEAIFMKDFEKENAQLEDLKRLLKEVQEDKKVYIENDIRSLKYGTDGEKNVYFELKNSFLPIICLHDIRIRYKDYVAQMDFVVISSSCIYVIECKKLAGDIEITKEGDFIRHIKDGRGKYLRKEGLYSPIAQNERHINILKEFLSEKLEMEFVKRASLMQDIVVVANPKTVISDRYAPKGIRQQIIRHDQLINFIKKDIEKKKDTWWIPERRAVRIAETLIEANEPLIIDYNKKYGLEDVVEENKVQAVEQGIMQQTEATTSVEEVDQQGEEILIEKLKKYRLEKSREEGVKPYFIYNNKEMMDLIEANPANIEELMNVKGFGKVKSEKYGEDLIGIFGEG